MRMISGGLIVEGTNLINRRRELFEVEVRLNLGELPHLDQMPLARQPPAWIAVEKDAAAGFQMFVDF